MQLSDDENDLMMTLQRALAQAEAMSLGFVAISISSAIDHLQQAIGTRLHLPASDAQKPAQ